MTNIQKETAKYLNLVLKNLTCVILMHMPSESEQNKNLNRETNGFLCK